MMIQSDELIFFRGVGQPPTRLFGFLIFHQETQTDEISHEKTQTDDVLLVFVTRLSVVHISLPARSS